jgi:HSP20 family molecular chaperone IbpA
MPSMDVKEIDKEISIEAELPGLDEKDVLLTIQNGVLTIEGEKKLEHEEEKENYHSSVVTAVSNAPFEFRTPSTKTRSKLASIREY